MRQLFALLVGLQEHLDALLDVGCRCFACHGLFTWEVSGDVTDEGHGLPDESDVRVAVYLEGTLQEVEEGLDMLTVHR